ncbi:DUF397 domain-containing protein [Nocardia sp. NPDC024068]|uniref:DUF397 domain-containing protein n=1 Tax=Nocardia sp. NPDC024068 TaxID=3157197 RepID=UPI0033DFE497
MTEERSGPQWFKSSHSGPANECVEVAWVGAAQVGVRDSKNPAGPSLLFTQREWAAFTRSVRSNASNA